MAATIYVNMGDDAKGECLEKDHTDWIEATGCTHAITQPKSTTRQTAGGTVSQANHADFQFTKNQDKATANIYKLVSTGAHLAKVTVDFVKPIGGKPTKYMVHEFTNAVVTGVQLDADTTGEDNPKETVSFSYDSASWTYTQVGADGKSKGNVAANWSRATGNPS
jgi:type VI secretion system secreted protein Hcp